MERESEYLYWVPYRQFIHYNEETDSYSYDSELPEFARTSFEKWLKLDHS